MSRAKVALRLSPSSRARWSVCPASAALRSEHDIKSSGNFYSEEGQAAHWHAAETASKIKKNGLTIDYKSEDKPETDYAFDERTMVKHAKDYKELLIFLIDLYEIIDLKIEYKYELEAPIKGHPVFGSVRQRAFSDIVLESDDVRIIIDYKYGAGQIVRARENPQLLHYMYLAGEPKKRNILVIAQPRNGGVSSWTLIESEAQAANWVAKSDVKFAVENPEHFESGTHCHWCPAVSMCPKLEADSIETVQAEFTTQEVKTLADPKTLTPEKLAFVLSNSKAVKVFLDACQSLATAQAHDGQEIPGYKLVRNFGNRAWKDESAAALKFKKFKPFKTVLLSPSALEKITGKGVIDSYVHKPEKSPVLATLSDRRETYAPAIVAAEDFS